MPAVNDLVLSRAVRIRPDQRGMAHTRAMKRLRQCATALLVLLGLVTWNGAQGAAADSPCRSVTAEGQEYVVCTADLRQHQVRLF